MTPQEYQFMQHKRQLITKMRYFCISLTSTCFKIKINNKKYYVVMKITPLSGRRFRIGRRLHVNQPLQPQVAATVRTHSDAVLSSTGALLMKTVIKKLSQ